MKCTDTRKANAALAGLKQGFLDTVGGYFIWNPFGARHIFVSDCEEALDHGIYHALRTFHCHPSKICTHSACEIGRFKSS